MVSGMKQITQSQRGSRTRASPSLRGEIESTVAKYAPEPEVPKATGPIAQAGFGGEMGPGQIARGAAEQPRMAQAPLSEIAASEADRIAKARAPRLPAYLTEKDLIGKLVAKPVGSLSEQEHAALGRLVQQEQFHVAKGPLGKRFDAELDFQRPPPEPGYTDLGPGTAAPSGEQRFAQLKPAPPRSVLTSRPRYRDVEPSFESNFDKAVFIVTNPGASKRHPEILAWVQSTAPKDFDVAGAGSAIRARLKSMYRPGDRKSTRLNS